MTTRLLVVDDDPLTGDLIAQCGRIANVDTCAVLDTRSFRVQLAAFKPTALMIDIVMPEEDGISLLRDLASNACRVPVILISAYGLTYLPAARRLGEAYGLQIVAAVSKPITPASITAALECAAARDV